MNAIAATTASKRRRSRKIPEALIYEIVDGRPIYYKGYKDVINGKQQLESVMADSTLQTWLKTNLGFLLMQLLKSKGYEIMSGELGILTTWGNRRGADVSIFREDALVLDAHYSKTAPEVIIEIDIQAELEDEDEMNYIASKINDYHRFGVKRVIWIFTSIKKITVAEPGKPWMTYDWNENIETLGGATFNLEKMLAAKQSKKA